MRALVVDLDAAAALREAAGGREPRLPGVGLAAELAGADAVRVSASEALRPVREADLHDLRRVVRQLELRLAPTPSLLKLALEVRPERVVLAGEPNAGRIDAAPLDAGALRAVLPPAARALREAGIPAWARLTPDPEAVKLARGAEVVGVELCAEGIVELPPRERVVALDRCADAARIAAKLRFAVAVGGGLDRAGVRAVLDAAPSVERLVIGRALIGRALLVGMDRAVGEIRQAL